MVLIETMNIRNFFLREGQWQQPVPRQLENVYVDSEIQYPELNSSTEGLCIQHRRCIIIMSVDFHREINIQLELEKMRGAKKWK